MKFSHSTMQWCRRQKMKKYELLADDTILSFGFTLFRIKALIGFGNVEVGEEGGYVAGEGNLSHYGNAWVSDNAQVSGNAWVSGDAQVSGNAWVSGDAQASGDAWVSDNAWVSGDAQVSGNAWVSGDAQASGDAWVSDNAWVSGDAQVSGLGDIIVFKNHWSSGRHFTFTKSNKMWRVGCFHGTGEELVKKAYADSENIGKHYEAYVKFVEQLEMLEVR